MREVQREFPITRMLVELEYDDLLPAIIFRSARKQCDADLVTLSRNAKFQLPYERRAKIEEEMWAAIRKFNLLPEVITGHEHYWALLNIGAGAHHAGQLFPWRILLEELMTKGVLRMLIATGTVAAGVDFPARTVVITAHSKRGNDGFRVLTASEFQQMSGRAGRRGKDAVGVCLVAPSIHSDARVIHEVAGSPPEPLKSAYYAAPATVLNLLKHRNVDDLHYTVSRSLAAFLDKKASIQMHSAATNEEAKLELEKNPQRRKLTEKRIRRIHREADEHAARQVTLVTESLRGLEALGYVQRGSLTEKGSWAAELCTTLVLELAECIDQGIFTEVTPTVLGGLVAALSGDTHRTYLRIKANPIPKAVFRSLEAIIKKIRSVYSNPFADEVGVVADASVTVMTWMECRSWDEFQSLLKLGQVSSGDVARLVTQSADHLNQISKLDKTHPHLAQTAIEARMMLLRPPLSDAVLVT
jgi:ATP-dependent RNA helicase HelY